MSRRLRAVFPVAALLLVFGLLLHGAYIPAKAWLAQVLLDHAWARRLAGATDVRPWPWADTVPLARIRQPRLGIEQIVLDGASGRVLAFGPGHVVGTARPGAEGNVVISGHRDTHFRWLEALREGDALILEVDDGRLLGYAVTGLAIHHESDTRLLDPLAPSQLRLITCYPFDALDPGSALRYVVTARPMQM